ncbi:hypothetical protein FPQ18DRAFT_396388 [Pyronema domesticum]|nr:hypothetical protein FPQ18DRAFT_396388 [Pyronema domesticum]
MVDLGQEQEQHLSRNANHNHLGTPRLLSEHAHASASSMNIKSSNAYLDGEKIIRIAKQQRSDAVHPGYG